MKKLIFLLITVLLSLTLTACNNFISKDGEYEGETDADGVYNGFGVWVYHNFRYEGYFKDGLPNGDGVLYQAKPMPADREDNLLYAATVITQGTFINGYANGPVAHTWYMEQGDVHTWRFEMDMGYSTMIGRQVIADDGVTDLTVDADYLIAVPPFADNVHTYPNISAPRGESNLPAGPGDDKILDIPVDTPTPINPQPTKPPRATPSPVPPTPTPTPTPYIESPDIRISKTIFSPGEALTINVYGITQEMKDELVSGKSNRVRQ